MRAPALLSWFVPCAVFTIACSSAHGGSAFTDDSPDASAVDSGGPAIVYDAGPGLSSDGAADDGSSVTDPHTPVDVMATGDNAYGFGWGDASSMSSYIANPAAT